MCSLPLILKWLAVLTGIQLCAITSGRFSVSANFNLFLDRREFQKLHGISSDIYYVLEGVVNQYALNFLVTVPPEVDDLHFSWQALTKRGVHYDMVMEYTDFFALLPPVANITHSGRVPHNLETFKVSLLCSGRSNAEVSVTIRMNFQVRHPKPNTTSINIKRNKICLYKEPPPPTTPKLPEVPSVPVAVPIPAWPSQPIGAMDGNLIPQSNFPLANSTLLFQDGTTPSLLLAGLLGGCAVTASVVFLIFFICLKRKLTSPSSNHPPSSQYGGGGYGYGSSSTSNNSSPACLLRQSQQLQLPDNQIWNHFSAEKCHPPVIPPPPSSVRSGSQNSYVTIASFWNDIFSTNSNSRQIQFAHSQPNVLLQQQQQKDQKYPTNSDRGSDVSPYAYAHIVPKAQPQPQPKITPNLIEWYSQYPCAGASAGKNLKVTESENNSQVPMPMPIQYSFDPTMSTFSPKPNYFPKALPPVPVSGPSAPSPSSPSSSSVSSAASYSSTESEQQRPSSKEGHGQKVKQKQKQKQRSTGVGTGTGTGTSVTSDCDSRIVVQIDGFQVRKDFDKESNVVERFL